MKGFQTFQRNMEDLVFNKLNNLSLWNELRPCGRSDLAAFLIDAACSFFEVSGIFPRRKRFSTR